MIQAWLAKKAAGIGVWLALCAALAFALWIQTNRVALAEFKAEALAQRLVNANAQVQQANRGLDTCVIANRDTKRAVMVCHVNMEKLEARGAKLDAQLAQARKQAATLLAESEAEDAAVERDPSHVPAQAHNEAIRRRGEGIWR